MQQDNRPRTDRRAIHQGASGNAQGGFLVCFVASGVALMAQDEIVSGISRHCISEY